MSLAAQAKFLRVLQEREFQRLGATRPSRRRARGRRDQPGSAQGGRAGTFREDCSTGCRCSTSTSPRCASAAAISCPWPKHSCRRSPRVSGGRRRQWRATPVRRCCDTIGRETYASSAIGSSEQPSSRRGGHRGESPGAAAVVLAGPRRHDQPEGRRARHHRAGAPAVPMEQGAGGAASRPDANAAVCPDTQVRARADGPRGDERGRVKEPPRRGDVQARPRPRAPV